MEKIACVDECGIVAAKMADKILAPFWYNGTMASGFFEFGFSNQLLPSLNKSTVIVMDNAPFHFAHLEKRAGSI